MRIRFFSGLCIVLFCGWNAVAQVPEQPSEDISEYSLDALLDIGISAAAKYAQTSSEAPAAVTIITSEDIRLYGYYTLGDALRSLRGFYISNDRNYVYLGSRGFSRPTDYNNRILLLIDGMVINDNVYGSAGFGTAMVLDLDIVERIEVIRGPGSALYGTGAMFAVVNVVTRSGTAVQGARVSATLGSHGDRRGTLQWGRELANGTSFLVSLIARSIAGEDIYFPEYDDPETNNGIAENLDWDDSFGALVTVHSGNLSVLARFSSREKGIPTGAYEVNFNDPASRSLDREAGLEIKYERPLGAAAAMMFRTHLNSYSFRGTYPYEDDYFEITEGRWAGTELQYRRDFQANHRLLVGLEFQEHLRAEYRTWDTADVYFDGDFPYSTWSLYVQDERQLSEKLALTLGLRHDNHCEFQDSTTPRVALVYHPSQRTTFKLLYGHAFRAPNQYEANYEDPVEQKINPNLGPEKIRTAELIWEHRWEEIFATASLYHYDMNDLIDSTVDPEDDLWYFDNLSRVATTGFELELNGRFTSGLHGYLSYSFQKAEGRAAGELSNSPRHLAKFGLSSPFGSWIRAAAEMSYESGRLTVYDTQTDSFLFARVNIATQAKRKKSGGFLEHWRFSMLIDNVFDSENSTPGRHEHIQAAIAQEGRRFVLKVEYRF